MVVGFACAAASRPSWHACDVSVSWIHSNLHASVVVRRPVAVRVAVKQPCDSACSSQATLCSECSGLATLCSESERSGDQFVQFICAVGATLRSDCRLSGDLVQHTRAVRRPIAVSVSGSS